MAKAEIKIVYETVYDESDIPCDEYKMYEPEIVFGAYPRDLLYFIANDELYGGYKIDVALDYDILDALNGFVLKINEHSVFVSLHKFTHLNREKAQKNEYVDWSLTTLYQFNSEDDDKLLDLLNKFDEFVLRFRDSGEQYILK
jgi:hypothetical protein